jgi:hypothetical protein
MEDRCNVCYVEPYRTQQQYDNIIDFQSTQRSDEIDMDSSARENILTWVASITVGGGHCRGLCLFIVRWSTVCKLRCAGSLLFSSTVDIGEFTTCPAENFLHS